jgi:hypothetical protein
MLPTIVLAIILVICVTALMERFRQSGLPGVGKMPTTCVVAAGLLIYLLATSPGSLLGVLIGHLTFNAIKYRRLTL